MSVENTIASIDNAINNLKEQKKWLQHPLVVGFSQLHPDAEVSIYISATGQARVTLNSVLSARECKGWDLYPVATLVDTQSLIHESEQVLYEDEELKIILRVTAYQYLEEDEKDLLRALGKIRAVAASYQALVC